MSNRFVANFYRNVAFEKKIGVQRLCHCRRRSRRVI